MGRYRSRRAIWERDLNLRADEHDEGDQVLDVSETVCPSDAQLDLASQLLHGIDAGMRRAPIPLLLAVPGRLKGHFEDQAQFLFEPICSIQDRLRSGNPLQAALLQICEMLRGFAQGIS